MESVTIELYNFEYSVPVPTADGYTPYFTDNLEEAKSKAREAYGEDVTINVVNIED